MGFFRVAAQNIDCEHSFKHAFIKYTKSKFWKYGENDINHNAIRAKVLLNTSKLKLKIELFTFKKKVHPSRETSLF